MAPYIVLPHHHHEEESHCEADNSEVESHPCHVSIYHAEDTQKKHCEHNHHFQDGSVNCETCKFVSSNTSQFVQSEITTTRTFSYSIAYPSFDYRVTPYTFPRANFNKGPPAYFS